MSDPVSYLQEMDAMACQSCDTRKRLEAEVAELRKRRDELLVSNNEFEQRYRDAKAKAATLRSQLQASEALVGRSKQAISDLLSLLRSIFGELVRNNADIAAGGEAAEKIIERAMAVFTLTPTAALSDYRDEVLADFLRRQQAFSAQAFGPGKRTKGLIDHISKELKEIEADPTDLSEFIDVILLAFDGFWRHGGKPEELLPALEAKLAKNMARTWPKPTSEDHAIEHVKEADEIRTMKEAVDAK
jgi:chromosome segregation ATPase